MLIVILPFLHMLIFAFQLKEKNGLNTLQTNTLLAPVNRTRSRALALAIQAVVTKVLEVAVNQTIRKTRKITMISRATKVAGEMKTRAKRTMPGEPPEAEQAGQVLGTPILTTKLLTKATATLAVGTLTPVDRLQIVAPGRQTKAPATPITTAAANKLGVTVRATMEVIIAVETNRTAGILETSSRD